MKHSLKITAVIAVMALAAGSVRAQQTNLVQTLSIDLSGVKQGNTTTNGNTVVSNVGFVTLSTADVIRALGTATGNTFSRSATLQVVTALPNGPLSVNVVDGGNTVNVSRFVVIQPVSGSVDSSVTNTRNGRTSGNTYSIEQFVLQDGYAPLTLHFNVNGVAVGTFSNAAEGQNTDVDASVAGSGDRNGDPLILEGTVRIFGDTLQVVSSQPPPGV
jgi:hypothetical protein